MTQNKKKNHTIYCMKLAIHICFIIPSSKFDAYTNYVSMA